MIILTRKRGLIMAQKTSEQLVGIFEDQRDIKNLMGKVCYTILLKREREMVDRKSVV